MFAKLIHFIFYFYTILLAIRIIGSWFPRVAYSSPMRFLGRFVDPYLNLFKRFIPPLGGVLDLSPLLGYFVLQAMEYLILCLFK